MKAAGLILLLLASCRSAPEGPRIEALDPEWELIAWDLAHSSFLAEREAARESERHYRLALAHVNRGALDAARADAKRAIELGPENAAAQRLLSEIRSVPPPALLARPSCYDVMVNLSAGKRFLEEGKPREALEKFEQFEAILDWLPPGTKERLLPEVRELARLAREGLAR